MLRHQQWTVVKPTPLAMWAQYYFCHVVLVTASTMARSESRMGQGSQSV